MKSLRLLETKCASDQNGQINEQLPSEVGEEEPDMDEDLGDAVDTLEDSNVSLCHFGLVILNENVRFQVNK